MDGDLATANSNDFQTFLETYNIQKISSSAYSNWQIGAIEQKVAKTKENVRKIILQTRGNWPDYLGFILQSINRTPTSSTLSPEMIIFGYSKPTTIDPLIFDIDTNDLKDYADKINNLVTRYGEHVTYVKKKKAEQNEKYLNKKTKAKHFELNQIVMYQRLKIL